MSNGGKFELGVASKDVASTKLESIVVLLLRDDTMHYLFQYSDIKEMKYEVALNEKIDSRDNAVEDPVENIGAKLVPAGNPMDKGSLDESS
ncbi:hypothetical protein Bca4012_066458 [Brassica carinata]